MSIPSSIFLDTNIYERESYSFESIKLAEFTKLRKEKSLQLLMPSIIRDEIWKHMTTKTDEFADKVSAIFRFKGVPFLSKTPNFPVLAEDFKDSLVKEQKAKVDNFFRENECVYLDCSNVAIGPIIESYLNSKPPFSSDKKKEFPDAIALEAISNFAEVNNEIVAVVSGDKGVLAYCEGHSKLLPFESLPAVLENLNIGGEDDSIKLLLDFLVDYVEVWADKIVVDFDHHIFMHMDYGVLSNVRLIDKHIVGETLRVIANGAGTCIISFRIDLRFSAFVEFDNNARFYLAHRYREHEEGEPLGGWLEDNLAEIVGTAKIAYDIEKGEAKILVYDLDDPSFEVWMGGIPENLREF